MRHRSVPMIPLSILAAFVLASPASSEERFDVTRYLDADTLFHFGSHDLAAYHDHLSASTLGTLFEEPEVQIFVEEVAGGITKEIEGFREYLGISFSDVPRLFAGQTTFSATGFDPGDNPFADRLLFTAEVGDAAPVFEALLARTLKRIEEATPNVERSSFEAAGVRLERIQVGAHTLVWTFHRGVFFSSTDPDALAALLTRIERGRSGGLAENPRYRAALARTGAGRPGIFLYVDAKGLLGRFEKFLEEPQKKVIHELGLDRVAAIGVASTLTRGGAVDRVYIHAPGAEDGIWRIFDEQPRGIGDSLELVPRGSFLVQAGSFDLARFLDTYIEIVRSVSPPEAYAEASKNLDMFREYAGTTLPGFWDGSGDETVLYATLPEEGGLMPDVVLVVRLNDPEAFAARLDRLLDRATAPGAEEPALDVRTIPFPAGDFRYINLSRSGVQQVIAPGFRVHGDYLVVAQAPQPTKRAILRLARALAAREGDAERARGFESIVAEPDFARTTSLLSRRHGSIGYVDLARGLVAGYNTLVPFFQAVLPKGDVPFEPGLLPTGEALSRHLFGVAWATYRDRDGLAIELASPVGIAPFLGTAALLGALGEAQKGKALLAAGQGAAELPSLAVDYQGVPMEAALRDLATRAGVGIHFPAPLDLALEVSIKIDSPVPFEEALGRVLAGSTFKYRLRELPGGERQVVVYR